MKKVFIMLFALVCLVGLVGGVLTVSTRKAAKHTQAVEPANTQALQTISQARPLAANSGLTVKPARCVIQTGVTGGRVNLRSCGSLACSVLAVLAEGEPVIILEPGPWQHVKTGNDLTGYVYSDYCK
ncbi:MAG TPA: SH3 domain-containing protein [Anaerolineales bacterium]|jgi:hypothetical protein